MESAAPALLVTPKEKQVLISTKEYKINHDNEEYIIEVGNSSLSNALGFRLKETSAQTKKCYENFFSLEELQKLNKYFRLFDNIKEAISNIEDIFEEKKFRLNLRKMRI